MPKRTATGNTFTQAIKAALDEFIMNPTEAGRDKLQAKVLEAKGRAAEPVVAQARSIVLERPKETPEVGRKRRIQEILGDRKPGKKELAARAALRERVEGVRGSKLRGVEPTGGRIAKGFGRGKLLRGAKIPKLGKLGGIGFGLALLADLGMARGATVSEQERQFEAILNDPTAFRQEVQAGHQREQLRERAEIAKLQKLRRWTQADPGLIQMLRALAAGSRQPQLSSREVRIGGPRLDSPEVTRQLLDLLSEDRAV